MKKAFKQLKDNELVIHPLKHNNEYIDYVYGHVGSNIAIKAFKEPNRVEESSNAFVELDKLKK